ncbi:MAG: hypothetical protein R6U92_05865 [Bacillota bacterium]
MSGLITGVAASLSLAASEYLSQKTEDHAQRTLKSAAYTGMTYIVTAIILILPYLTMGNHYRALATTVLAAILIIAVFDYYISVAKDYDFRARFLEMTAISLGVAILTLFIGYAIRATMGAEI